MGEATITCRICEREESFRIGWKLYNFNKNGLPLHHDRNYDQHNLCDDCINALLEQLGIRK